MNLQYLGGPGRGVVPEADQEEDQAHNSSECEDNKVQHVHEASKLKFNHLLYQQDRHQNLAAEMNIVNTVNLKF